MNRGSRRIVVDMDLADIIGCTDIGHCDRVCAVEFTRQARRLDAFIGDLLQVEIGRPGPPDWWNPPLRRIPFGNRIPAGETLRTSAGAIAIHLDIANMAGFFGIRELAVIIDEPARTGRGVEWPHERHFIPLQTMNDQRTAGNEAGGLGGVVTQRIARAPECALACERDTARSILVIDRKPDRIFVRHLNPVSGLIAGVAQDGVAFRLLIFCVVLRALNTATLGKNHLSARGKENVGNGFATRN